MKLSPRLALAAAIILLGGCARESVDDPFIIVVRGPAASCSIEVGGRRVTSEELLVIARPEAKPGRSAYIDANMEETPYRCFGGALYTLQMAGFEDVGFPTEPPR